MNVYQKLNEARERFHRLPLTKSGHNKFAGYYYFELGDFLIPAMGVFREVGLCAVVSFDADKACMLIRNVEKPDEFISIYSPMGSAALKGCHEVQNIGAVETYQRRYLWVAALEIVEHDALDASTGKVAPEPDAAKPGKPDPLKNATPIKATAGCWESVPPDEHPYLRELAEELKGMSPGAAVDRLEAEGLDNMQKVCVWDCLPSNIRSGIKKEQEQRHMRAAIAKQKEAA